MPHESLSSCSLPFAWLAAMVRQFVTGLQRCVRRAVWRTSVVCEEQCCVKYKYICICTGSSASFQNRVLKYQHFEKAVKKTLGEMCIACKNTNDNDNEACKCMFHMVSHCTPYADRNIVKARLVLQKQYTIINVGINGISVFLCLHCVPSLF